MRRSSYSPPPSGTSGAGKTRQDLAVLKTLFPYLWAYKGRVMVALACLILAKLAVVSVPLILKSLIDHLTKVKSGTQIALPVGLLLGYGLLRLTNTFFTELREFVFAKVTQRAVRTIALQVFRHLHSLSLRFHLNRQTGGMTRDIERGTRGVSSLVSYALFSILPTLIEISLVLVYLITHYDIWFSVITFFALVLYIGFTVSVTEWRTHFRRTMNDLDSSANTKAIDSLINYETVKYFGNEDVEAMRYDQGLQRYERAAVKSQTSLSVLNVGQSGIIAIAVSLILWRATVGVIAGKMSLGDLVLVNSFMIQLYVPLNFLGVLYREIKQSLADMEKLFSLLGQHREIADNADAVPLRLSVSTAEVVNSVTETACTAVTTAATAAETAAGTTAAAATGPELCFSAVDFSYEENRQILHQVTFVMPAGMTTAVVGTSGSGKSTLARLLFRFYDIQGGSITIAGQDIRTVKQATLRAAIGIVPQDTVLFNDTIEYNIGYGRPEAGVDEIMAAAKAAYIHDFIMSLPSGYATMVGERGLKLSGGERQRVAIARTILKNPAILIFDEATSALDSRSEQAIQTQLKEIAKGRTSLVIAHRLSTIVDAAQILVMEHGRIVERGTHAELLAMDRVYAQMWARQQSAPEPEVWEEGAELAASLPSTMLQR